MSVHGKVVVFTGTLTMKRADAKQMAEKAGAIVTSSVTGKTDILVAGENAGSKRDAAKAKGVAVWTEDQFVAACGGDAAAPEPAAKPAGRKRHAAEDEEEHKYDDARANKTQALAQPLAGMRFVRTGDFQYQKAVGELVTSLGGEWVKKAAQATAGVNGRGDVMHAKNWTKNVAALLEQNKPIAVLEHSFTRGGAPTAAMADALLGALETARNEVCANASAGTSAAELAKAYREAFPNVRDTYGSDTAASFWADQIHQFGENEGCSADAVLTQGRQGRFKWSKPPNW